MISSSQRHLPDNTKHSQQTNIHAPGGIRTCELSRRAAADLRLWPRCYWEWHFQNVRVDKLTAPRICYERTDWHSSLSPISFTPFLLALYFLWELFEIFQSDRRHSPKPRQILMNRATTVKSDGAETNHSLRYRWKNQSTGLLLIEGLYRSSSKYFFYLFSVDAHTGYAIFHLVDLVRSIRFHPNLSSNRRHTGGLALRWQPYGNLTFVVVSFYKPPALWGFVLN
jgi:hypothetical protein